MEGSGSAVVESDNNLPRKTERDEKEWALFPMTESVFVCLWGSHTCCVHLGLFNIFLVM